MPTRRKSKYKKTQREYAEMFNRDVRTIREWQKKKYPLDDPEAMERKLAEQLHQRGRDDDDDEDREPIDAAALTDEQLENPRDPYDAKLYESILRCRKLTHALRESKRLVLSKEECKADMVRIGSAVKTRLTALPGEMPALLVGKAEHEIQKTLQKWVLDTLTEFSDAASRLYA